MQKTTIETKYDLIKIDKQIYHVMFLVSSHTDNNWGADADGNRYTSRQIIDEIEILDCKDGDFNDVEDAKLLDIIKEML